MVFGTVSSKPAGEQSAPSGVVAASEEQLRRVIDRCGFLKFYSTTPTEPISLFDLEALVMRRMELLAMIDRLRDAPWLTGSADLLQRVVSMLRDENFEQEALRGTSLRFPATDAPKDEIEAGTTLGAQNVPPAYTFESTDDDVMSHLCCRLVFCQTDAWRDWFVRNEEVLFRARIQKYGKHTSFLPALFAANKMPFNEVQEDSLSPEQRRWLRKESGADKELYCVPLSLALKAVRYRSCIVLNGQAIVPSTQVTDAIFSEFKTRTYRGLADAHFLRQRLLADTSSALTNTMAMLDSFFSRFIVDPTDSAKPVASGQLHAVDVPTHALVHFPLCMKRADDHLRREHHVKHNGRWMYGLFLKAIGLSIEESLKLFGSLLSLKAAKDFDKSAYAYNLRHMYGKEGKRTSYSSLTCTTIVNMAPNVDRFDCHGCPYRFKEEGQLRSLLQQPRATVTGQAVRITPQDIEDIVQDSKGMHYTRACFKYFVATHRDVVVARDTLFRSPLEYYLASVQFTTGDDVSPAKRPRDEVTPQRSVLPPRTEAEVQQ
jgi:DNA primase large subunit